MVVRLFLLLPSKVCGDETCCSTGTSALKSAVSFPTSTNETAHDRATYATSDIAVPVFLSSTFNRGQCLIVATAFVRNA